MADLRSMLEKAKKDAEDAKTNVKNLDKVEQNISDMDKKAVKAITLYVEQYPNTLTNAMDANAKKIDDYTARIQDTSIRLQKQVDNAKSTLALLTGSKDKGYIDITSAKLMLDYAEEYKIAYIVVICKTILFFIILTFIYSRRNLFLTFAVSCSVVILWYSWNFLLNFFRGNNIGGGTEKGKLCADGTPSDATGSNCEKTCPSSKAEDEAINSYSSQ